MAGPANPQAQDIPAGLLARMPEAGEAGLLRPAQLLAQTGIWLQIVQIPLHAIGIDGLRLGFAILSLLCFLALIVVAVLLGRRLARVCALFVILLLVNWTAGILTSPDSLDVSNAAQQLMLPAALAMASGILTMRQIARLAAPAFAMILFALGYGLLKPSAVIGSVERVQGFWQDGTIHPSAYIAATLTLFLFAVFPLLASTGKRIMAGVGIVLGLLLLLMFRVRTAEVLVLVSTASFFAPDLLRRFGLPLAVAALGIAALGLTVFISQPDEDLQQFSSGRTGVYQERIAYVASRDWTENIFGEGPGSDIMGSDVWWWEEKNSHNDFLTVLTERGFFGLASFLALLAFAAFRLPGRAYAFVFALALTSAISNGLLARPTPFVFMALTMAAAALLPRDRLEFYARAQTRDTPTSDRST